MNHKSFINEHFFYTNGDFNRSFFIKGIHGNYLIGDPNVFDLKFLEYQGGVMRNFHFKFKNENASSYCNKFGFLELYPEDKKFNHPQKRLEDLDLPIFFEYFKESNKVFYLYHFRGRKYLFLDEHFSSVNNILHCSHFNQATSLLFKSKFISVDYLIFSKGSDVSIAISEDILEKKLNSLSNDCG